MSGPALAVIESGKASEQELELFDGQRAVYLRFCLRQ